MIPRFIEKLIDYYKILYNYIFKRKNYETRRIVQYDTSINSAAPYLPDDCIYNILKYLQPYHSTLFNCLLVNRFWCKVTVPLLYANPFDYTINEKHSSIILTLILCFDKTEILQLKNQLKLINGGFSGYFWNLLLHKLYKVEYADINDKYKPLFNYSKYLENLDCDKINRTIHFWLKIPIPPYSPYYPRDRYNKSYENFIPIFYKSLLHQCNTKIKRLIIPLRFFKNQPLPSNLTKLNTLHIRLWYDYNYNVQEFLSNISNLRKFKLTLNRSPYDDCVKEKIIWLNDLFSSLQVQKYSLVTIEFYNVNFSNVSFKNFINLCNLKYLKFSSCEISVDQCEDLKYALFKLEGLYLYYDLYNEQNNIPIPSMIKYLGSSLKELTSIKLLEIPIIENILIYCPNLIAITLEINLILDIDLLVFSYFKNLKIRALNIFMNCYYDRDRKDELDEIMKCLASNLPTNVKEISFRSCLCFRKFFENYHNYYNCFEIINLDFTSSNNNTEGIFKIILNYIEKGDNSLKVLGIKKLKTVLNERELKSLNQIKAKGVKIEDFYNNYEYDDI